MKISYLVFFLILCSCNSIPKEYLTNNTCHYKNPIFKITKNEMAFDMKKYQKALEKGDLVLIDNDNFESRYYTYNDGEVTNKQTNKQLGIGKWIRYDKKGKIKFMRILYLNGTKNIYKKTYYDQQGNITKIIDYEKGYNICWAEAIEIVKKIAKKDIKKHEIIGYNLSHNNLNEFPNAKPEWQVSLDGNEKYEEKDTKIYVIDGVTGKFIKTYRITTE